MVNIVLPVNHPSSTKAVVIIYGWLGSIPKHVMKYTNLYTERGCAVVYDIANVMAVMSRFPKPLDDLALETVQKACELIKAAEEEYNESDRKCPVIVHYFSNGGAFVAERLGLLIKYAKDPFLRNQQDLSYVNHSAIQNLIFLSGRLQDIGYEIADSAPAYLHKEAAYNAVNTTTLNGILKRCINIFIFLSHNSSIFFNNILKRDQEDVVFWNNMMESDLCFRQVFIYSTIDKLTDPVKIDELIEQRKKCGINILRVKFDDSDHVSHLRKHPDMYNRMLDQIMDEISK